MLLDERPNEIDEVLRLTVAELDIPPAVRAAAINEYNTIAAWLSDSWPGTEGEIYPQGSLRLGTMITPVTVGCDYDVDLVCRLWLTKEISKAELKRAVGQALAAYVATRPAGSIRLEEGKRCWTLVYPGQHFHLDVLPAIPNEDDESEHAIWLTDRHLVRWQPSNPIGYAVWFSGRMEIDRLRLLEAAAAKRGIEVEDVPAEAVKTALQHGVQMLKRHRDIYFEKDPKLAPASIIVTTLAAGAYEGGRDIFDTLVSLTERMPELVEWQDGRYVVANPVLEDENFADRWAGRPRRSQAFFDWVQAAHETFGALDREPGVDRLLERLAVNLGAEPVERAGRQYAAGIRERQRTGRLITGSSGLLTTAPVVGAGLVSRTHTPTNPPHEFHGRTRNPPR